LVSHLVIGDAHSNPTTSSDRFEVLGKFIVDEQPDVIIDMGDFASLDSLSSYDRGKKAFEGRRYTADCEAARNSRDRLMRPIREYNAQRKKNKERQYKPRLVALLGNHEDRINRVCESSPELDGVISTRDLGAEEYGWSVYPFLDIVIIDGVAYSHYFGTGVKQLPAGGENPAHRLINTQFMSSTSGHLHLRDFHERTSPDGRRIIGLFPGCFLDPNQYEEYAGNANLMWWKGVVVCKDVANGTYDPNFISINELYRRYY